MVYRPGAAAGQWRDSDQEEPAGVGAVRLNPPPRIPAEGTPGGQTSPGGDEETNQTRRASGVEGGGFLLKLDVTGG